MQIILEKEEYLELKPNQYINKLVADIEEMIAHENNLGWSEHTILTHIKELLEQYKEDLIEIDSENLLW